jgi:hypothetical protein
MLDLALQFLKDQLNSYIVTRTGSATVEVKMSRVVDDMGKYAIDEGSIGATIINIEEDRILKNHLPEYNNLNGQHRVMEPELKLNLDVMFAANLKLYDVALKYISYVLTFFQSHPFFMPEQYPSLDPRIEKLTMELRSLSYEQLNQVWAFIGGKQLPSVIYRVRMVALQDEALTEIQPPLTSIYMDLYSR